MRNVGRRMKNEFKKFLYGPLNPVVTINFRVQIIGGTENHFGAVVGGVENRGCIQKKCHAVVLREASRSLFNAGIFNEGAVLFHFDRDDETIRFDLWEEAHIIFQGNNYSVDPLKIEKAKAQLVTLAETSMATVIVGEMEN